ncbi:hypothetical protein QBC45DRAFT_395310 [Copromyces sp. CBS 386.78]|nr:hypothetical protein QBC45DRAFT_395310 [Copromyces sp. CBS 386.78]
MPWIEWTEWTKEEESNAQVQIFSSADLFPIGEDSPDDKNIDKKSNTMRSLTVQMADIAREWFGYFDELTNHTVLLRSLGKAATQCSDMEVYMRISLFLFLAVNMFWVLISPTEAGKELGEVWDIGRKYLRN